MSSKLFIIRFFNLLLHQLQLRTKVNICTTNHALSLFVVRKGNGSNKPKHNVPLIFTDNIARIAVARNVSATTLERNLLHCCLTYLKF